MEAPNHLHLYFIQQYYVRNKNYDTSHFASFRHCIVWKEAPRLGGSKIWSGNHNEETDPSHTTNKILVIQPIAS